MPPVPKKNAPLVLGILSIVISLFMPLIGLILGIIGTSLSYNYASKTEFDYKAEKILNIVGIVIATLIMVFTLVFFISNIS